MDLFSEDLFNVFEETEKPTAGKSKKRKREAQESVENVAGTPEDSKKVKVDSVEDSGSSVTLSSEVSVVAGSSQKENEESKTAESSQTQDNEVWV